MEWNRFDRDKIFEARKKYEQLLSYFRGHDRVWYVTSPIELVSILQMGAISPFDPADGARWPRRRNERPGEVRLFDFDYRDEDEIYFKYRECLQAFFTAPTYSRHLVALEIKRSALDPKLITPPISGMEKNGRTVSPITAYYRKSIDVGYIKSYHAFTVGRFDRWEPLNPSAEPPEAAVSPLQGWSAEDLKEHEERIAAGGVNLWGVIRDIRNRNRVPTKDPRIIAALERARLTSEP